MQKRVVIKNGKKYIVNTVGWEDGIGSGGPVGTLWMQSTDGNWYSIALTGTNPAASVDINQTPLSFVDPGGQFFPYVLLPSNDGNVYKVSLTGNAGSVAIAVDPTPWYNPSDYKDYLLLQSGTDQCFYRVGLVGSPPTDLTVDQNSQQLAVFNR